MKPTNFSRTNVSPSAILMTSPERSSYDLSHRTNLTLPLGKFIPVNVEKIIPGTTSRINLSPSLSLETLQVPEIGRMRLDQHTFAVSARRINRDFRLFYEGNENYKSLPTFNVGNLQHNILRFVGLYRYTSEPFTWVNQFTDYLEALDTDSNPAAIAANLLRIASANYANKIFLAGQSGDPAIYVPFLNRGYLLDFFRSEQQRLNELSAYYAQMAEVNGEFTSFQNYVSFAMARVSDVGAWNEELFEPAIAIYEIIKPYLGEGSLCDMLGLHTVKRYSRQFYRFANVLRNNMVTLGAVDFNNMQPQADATMLRDSLMSFFDSPYAFYSHLSDGDTFTTDLREAVLFSMTGDDVYSGEMELRAVYSAWYDQLRNWHVEKRENVLDPDTFDNNSIVHYQSISPSIEFFLNRFIDSINLLLPRYCYWSKDFFTTIQTEDKFRYVFSPVSREPGSVAVADPVGNIATAEGLQAIESIITEEFESAFPFGSLFRPDGVQGLSPTSFSVLRNDLQTMRRAGMVERYLARTYYHPDTYIGQIQARFGIEPQDIDLISSRYLFGQESLIEGEQVKNATGTEETPAGLRTLVAGAGNSEGSLYENGAEFTYVVSFCSFVPLSSYDPLNMHINEKYLLDLPTPEFANDTRITIRQSEFMRDCVGLDVPIGYVPRYYQYRLRADEAHGDYLTDKRAFIWLNDTYNHYKEVHFTLDERDNNRFLPGTSVNDWMSVNPFQLDAYALHVHVNPDAFLNLREWDSIAYGNVDIVFEVNTILPGAVDMF